ncbi:RluA family pseudouridine synthase [Sphingomonas abietis]|uniref:RNA pseudouridine synthase n=1 Tax=Sphingomonas abietis TaxID=3012344 RepID=A0ABY7NQR8_9SPHN|nr:RNA pseudouridine synthase [Sphingomonas abietis]WBO23315.1 RNA pseudouridine synthase [Sphingomonas abietis]
MLTDHILFIDAEAIVIDKPAGLPVDTPRDGSPSVETARESLLFGFQRPPLAVHRLDRDTSGCLLLARNPRAHKRFAAAFEAGLADKTYLAVLDGVPADEGGRIALALSKYSTRADGWRMVPDARGKAATTDWRVLGVADGRALVEFRPQTGRTHQLRVHAAEGIGIPILGDPVYGQGGKEGASMMMLHAVRLGLPRDPHPAIAAEAPLPPSFAPWASLLDADA